LAARYAVRNVDMGNGEHMPLLVDVTTGLGVFEPTAFSLALRSRGRKANTLTAALGAVAFLYETLAAAKVDLMDRARSNDLLSLDEVEGLVARCKYAKEDLRLADEVANTANVSALRKTLKKSKAEYYDVGAVLSGTATKRLLYIAKYLEWLTDYVFLSKIAPNRNEFREIVCVCLLN